VRDPVVGVVRVDLVVTDRAVPLDGRTVAEVGAEAGIEPSPLDDVYSGGPGSRPDQRLTLDPDAAEAIAAAFAVGDRALRLLEPGADPVIWPEHFDIAVTVDQVNYGVSPGDQHRDAPYAYVGPWTPRSGVFWNAPFGAVRPLAELGDAAEVAAFFAEGRALVSESAR
jgi:hypothetical protein